MQVGGEEEYSTYCEGASIIFDSELQASLSSLGHFARCRNMMEIDHPSHQRYTSWSRYQITNVSVIVRCAWLPFM